jgi:hypothetical protein
MHELRLTMSYLVYNKEACWRCPVHPTASPTPHTSSNHLLCLLLVSKSSLSALASAAVMLRSFADVTVSLHALDF